MRCVLDTNVWIEAVAGRAHAMKAVEVAAVSEWSSYSAITRLEVFCFPDLTSNDEEAFQRVMDEFIELPVTGGVIDEAIRIRKVSRVKVPDAIIAATAILSDATLVTSNTADFQRIPGLRLAHPASL